MSDCTEREPMACDRPVTSRLRWNALCVAAVAGLLGAAFVARADERILYKSVLPGGRVVYSDAPAPNAKRSEKISVERHPPNPQDAEAAQRALTMTRAQLLRDSATRAARLKQIDNQVDETYSELKRAEAAMEQGQEIQEGDRQGRRLLPAYSQRRQALAGAVQRARQRLDKLLAERGALQQ